MRLLGTEQDYSKSSRTKPFPYCLVLRENSVLTDFVGFLSFLAIRDCPPRPDRIHETVYEGERNMKTAWLAVLSFLLATTMGFADSYKSEFDKAANFSQIKTYAFKSGLLMLGRSVHPHLDPIQVFEDSN